MEVRKEDPNRSYRGGVGIAGVAPPSTYQVPEEIDLGTFERLVKGNSDGIQGKNQLATLSIDHFTGRTGITEEDWSTLKPHQEQTHQSLTNELRCPLSRFHSFQGSLQRECQLEDVQIDDGILHFRLSWKRVRWVYTYLNGTFAAWQQVGGCTTLRTETHPTFETHPAHACAQVSKNLPMPTNYKTPPV